MYPSLLNALDNEDCYDCECDPTDCFILGYCKMTDTVEIEKKRNPKMKMYVIKVRTATAEKTFSELLDALPYLSNLRQRKAQYRLTMRKVSI